MIRLAIVVSLVAVAIAPQVSASDAEQPCWWAGQYQGGTGSPTQANGGPYQNSSVGAYVSYWDYDYYVGVFLPCIIAS